MNFSNVFYSLGLKTDEIVFGIPKSDLVGTALERICPPNPIAECVPGRYRTYSGFCNNVNNPLWGASFEPMQRFIAADYADGSYTATSLGSEIF